MSETKGTITRDFYYSDQWQVLEERVGGVTQMQYVWSPVYVDALALRDRSTQGNGVLDERLWVQQDANWNVAALINGSGAPVERYAYDPFGKATAYDGNWNAISGSAFAWQYMFQGGRLDAASGLYDFRNRWYSPTLGRWMQNDPLRFGSGDANFYRSMGNNPTNLVDPNGLATWDPADNTLETAVGPFRLHLATIRFRRGDFTDLQKRYIVMAVQRAFDAIERAAMAAEQVFQNSCPGNGRPLLNEEALKQETERFNKWFCGNDKCPDCDCLEKVSKTLKRMRDALSNENTLLDFYQDPKKHLDGGELAWHDRWSGNIGVNDYFWYWWNDTKKPMRSLKDLTSILVHELSHKLGGTDDKGGYYYHGYGADAIYTEGKDEHTLPSGAKCNNASAIQQYVMGFYQGSDTPIDGSAANPGSR